MEGAKGIILIGYSGHAFVVADIFIKNHQKIIGYCDFCEKNPNPFGLSYLGKETDKSAISMLRTNEWFVAIGDNAIRRNIFRSLTIKFGKPVNAIHPSAIIGEKVSMEKGLMIGAGAVINSVATIGAGVIVNTGAIIEHECSIGPFSHIAPGAVLCGNVKIGNGTFIGANTVVRQGITIGSNVVIGAGSVIIKDVPDNAVWAGNPARSIK